MLEKEVVVSSNIDMVGYADDSKTMFIRYKSGISYSYSDVARDVYSALKAAESVGQFFHRFIKGKYTYTRLTADPFAVQ